MSTLLVDYLDDEIVQTFQVKERVQTVAVRPWLYFGNDPAGTFKMAIEHDGIEVGSKELTMSEIKTLAGWNDNEYHHGFIKFDFSAILNINTDYVLKLSSTGYVYDPTSVIGWVKPHENLINDFSELIIYDDKKPFGFQLWGYK